MEGKNNQWGTDIQTINAGWMKNHDHKKQGMGMTNHKMMNTPMHDKQGDDNETITTYFI